MASMPRSSLPWLLALPLLAAGSLAGHSLAYRLVEPDAGERARLLHETGHAYLAAAPSVLGAGAALALAAVLAYAVRGRGGRTTPLPSWPVALVPPVGFAAQEHVERVLAGAGGTVGDPTFVVGLLLQLPFGLLALAAARRLAAAAVALGRSLAEPPSAAPGRAAPEPAPGDPPLRPVPVLATGQSERGPPRS